MLKIAICDDEQPIREYLKKLTEKCTDAEIGVFADGEELLSYQTECDIYPNELGRAMQVLASGELRYKSRF